MKYLVKDERGEFVWSDSKPPASGRRAGEAPVVGESLGCISSQLETMQADAAASGFRDIEFVEDPGVSGFFNCKAPNQRRFAAYAEHCGMADKNGHKSGVNLSADELAAAERLVRRKYPKAS